MTSCLQHVFESVHANRDDRAGPAEVSIRNREPGTNQTRLGFISFNQVIGNCARIIQKMRESSLFPVNAPSSNGFLIHIGQKGQRFRRKTNLINHAGNLISPELTRLEEA